MGRCSCPYGFTSSYCYTPSCPLPAQNASNNAIGNFFTLCFGTGTCSRRPSDARRKRVLLRRAAAHVRLHRGLGPARLSRPRAALQRLRGFSLLLPLVGDAPQRLLRHQRRAAQRLDHPLGLRRLLARRGHLHRQHRLLHVRADPAAQPAVAHRLPSRLRRRGVHGPRPAHPAARRGRPHRGAILQR